MLVAVMQTLHITSNPAVALCLARTGRWYIAGGTVSRIVLERVPVSPQCEDLARDAMRADVQDKAADLAEMTAADVDSMAERMEVAP